MLTSRALATLQMQQPLNWRDCEGFWGPPAEMDAARAGLAALTGSFELPSGHHVGRAEVLELRTVDQVLWKLWRKQQRIPVTEENHG